ncbi:uncharacterized protein BDZ99DRAFT_517564 [Mytilinidion resinicola]|uniref:Uncharacterized protein n=1 Tax=Mytilinidion resinicola TaxID=574789 RepID=A0A6A6YXR7_9PEZI|nr:uncharacterized protein BDZ99DRAFT_517564 [Mytilinidion resinicola]KAF2813289.1 hypothetical protein BDZ99DRAFT_517564 [Mytilinidion resinicola]
MARILESGDRRCRQFFHAPHVLARLIGNTIHDWQPPGKPLLPVVVVAVPDVAICTITQSNPSMRSAETAGAWKYHCAMSRSPCQAFPSPPKRVLGKQGEVVDGGGDIRNHRRFDSFESANAAPDPLPRAASQYDRESTAEERHKTAIYMHPAFLRGLAARLRRLAATWLYHATDPGRVETARCAGSPFPQEDKKS